MEEFIIHGDDIKKLAPFWRSSWSGEDGGVGERGYV